MHLGRQIQMRRIQTPQTHWIRGDANVTCIYQAMRNQTEITREAEVKGERLVGAQQQTTLVQPTITRHYKPRFHTALGYLTFTIIAPILLFGWLLLNLPPKPQKQVRRKKTCQPNN